MGKRKIPQLVTPKKEFEVEICGLKWKYRPITGGERDRILDKYTKVNPHTGAVTQDMVAALEEMWSVMIVEVPDELKKQFKQEYGREWRGTPEDFKLLTGTVRDELVEKIPFKLEGEAAKN